jgi:hypothetical protein
MGETRTSEDNTINGNSVSRRNLEIVQREWRFAT